MPLKRGPRRKTNYLSPQQAADLIDAHVNTIRNWVYRNEIKFVRNPKNNRIKISEPDLVEFVRENFGLDLDEEEQ